ncbi:MAG TPA: alpha/beta hydrolase [Longimicrobiaceae bacterium]|nr:alpha/beta hydrolase [Longimicrobiaceae bacterium]
MNERTEPQANAPILSHSRVEASGRDPERWLLVLHGIYGKGRNWGSVARRVVDARPEWGALLVDLRMHGDSRGFRPPHTVESSAEDLRRLVEHLELPAAGVLGHSFGGKVALAYARERQDGLDQVWVMDSTPAIKVPSGSAWRMIGIVRSLPEEFGSRAEAVEALQAHGYDKGLAQWMAMNLEPDDDVYRWAINWDAMEAMLRDFFRTELWDVVERPPAGVEIHFAKATQSDTLDEEAVARIEAVGQENERIFLHRLEGGHWINTDNPDAVVELLVSRLS